MDARDRELLATYRAEAASFFAVNQAGRTAAERSIAILFSVVAVAVVAGINAQTANVALGDSVSPQNTGPMGHRGSYSLGPMRP